MSRRAFRPVCLDTLEGRIAPSLVAPHLQVKPRAAVKPAHTSTMQSAINSVKNVNWHKLGTQVTDFLGITHASKAPAKLAKVAHPVTTAHALTR
jgi:hypothetical protein